MRRLPRSGLVQQLISKTTPTNVRLANSVIEQTISTRKTGPFNNMENPIHRHQELTSLYQSATPSNPPVRILHIIRALPTPNHQIQPEAAEKPEQRLYHAHKSPQNTPCARPRPRSHWGLQEVFTGRIRSEFVQNSTIVDTSRRPLMENPTLYSKRRHKKKADHAACLSSGRTRAIR